MQTAEPDYLYDTEAKRGRLEKSFTAIGSSVCLGAGVGGAYGLFDGIRYLFVMLLYIIPLSENKITNVFQANSYERYVW